MRPFSDLWIGISGGSDVPTLELVSAVPFCHRIHYLNGSVVFLYDDRFRVYVYCLTQFNCTADLCFRCGGVVWVDWCRFPGVPPSLERYSAKLLRA